jgi:glutathione S-transferase
MSSTTYEVIYFPLPGRAEPIRLLFACAGVPFNDVAVTNWPELKPQMPLGQLPVLREKTEGGEVLIPQSGAILRHLARTFGLYGASEREHTIADVLADTLNDVRMKFAPVAFAQMMNTPKETVEKYWADLPQTLSPIVKLLGLSTAPAAGFFVGEKPTYADVLAFDTLHQHLSLKADCLDFAPALKSFVGRFRELPGIAAYLAKK